MLRYKIAPKCLLPGPFGHSDVGGNPGVVGRFVAIISFLHTPVSIGRGGGTGLLEHQGGRPAPARGGGPSSDSVRIQSQGLRRTRSGPSLGQQLDGVPSFPLPGCRCQNKPPVHVLDFHPPLFQRPIYLPHTHHLPSSNY